MQKWIGIGKIDGEPEKVKFDSKDALLVWINVPRSWSQDSDNVPVLFCGKRMDMLTQASKRTKALTGALVYVMGEISSRIRLVNNKVANIGCCVFASSIEFWDVENMTDFTKNKPNNKVIFLQEGEINGRN